MSDGIRDMRNFEPEGKPAARDVLIAFRATEAEIIQIDRLVGKLALASRSDLFRFALHKLAEAEQGSAYRDARCWTPGRKRRRKPRPA